MELQDVKYENRDGVAWITINRPEVLNALRIRTLDDILEAFKEAERDRTVGVVVLTGTGDKAFCVGGDLNDLSALDSYGGRLHFGKFLQISTVMRNLGKPVISSINGYCLGGGNELHTFSDLSIASDKARFGQVGAKIGALPVWGATQLLPRLVGERKAREMLFLCKQYTAQEALEMGLVNIVVPHEDLYKVTDEWCQTLLDMSPQTLRLLKTSLNFESDLLYPSYTHAQQLISAIAGSEEALEGMKAFLEKRKSNFRRFRN